jgi:hypothetical protein
VRDIAKLIVESRSNSDTRVGLNSEYTPLVHAVTMRMAAGKTAHVHYWIRGQAKERDLGEAEVQVDFLDEELANRLAKALVHAVELCGGGDKYPFS